MALVECNPSARPTSGGFNSIGPSLMIWSGRGGRPSVTSNSTEPLRSMQIFIIVLPWWFYKTTFLWQLARHHNVTPLTRIFNYLIHNALYLEKSMSCENFYFVQKYLMRKVYRIISKTSFLCMNFKFTYSIRWRKEIESSKHSSRPSQ